MAMSCPSKIDRGNPIGPQVLDLYRMMKEVVREHGTRIGDDRFEATKDLSLEVIDPSLWHTFIAKGSHVDENPDTIDCIKQGDKFSDSVRFLIEDRREANGAQAVMQFHPTIAFLAMVDRNDPAEVCIPDMEGSNRLGWDAVKRAGMS